MSKKVIICEIVIVEFKIIVLGIRWVLVFCKNVFVRTNRNRVFFECFMAYTVCVYVCVCECIYTHKYTHINTCIHTHIYTEYFGEVLES